jgi:hypothetical protein
MYGEIIPGEVYNCGMPERSENDVLLPSGGKIYYSENDILLIDLVKIYRGFVIKLTIVSFKNF